MSQRSLNANPSCCRFSSLGSVTAALHDSQYEISLMYLSLGLGAAPEFIHRLKQAVLAPPTLTPSAGLCSTALPRGHRTG